MKLHFRGGSGIFRGAEGVPGGSRAEGECMCREVVDGLGAAGG